MHVYSVRGIRTERNGQFTSSSMQFWKVVWWQLQQKVLLAAAA